MKKIMTLLIFLISSIVFSQNANHDDLKNYLIKDLEIEISTADFLTPEIINKHSKAETVYLKQTSKHINIETIEIEKLRLDKGHAIENLDKYVEQRLGTYVVNAVKNGLVDLKVFAGNEANFAQFITDSHEDLKQIIKLPSVYEEWGIYKYLVQKSEGKSTIFFRIPNSKKYTLHYSAMIGYITKKSSPNAYYDHESEKITKNNFINAEKKISHIIGNDYDMISFGYSYMWDQILKERSDWKLLESIKASDIASGVNAEIIHLENSLTGKKHKVLLLGNSKTVWGELASMMILPFVNKNTKSVVFMGSAGSVSNKNSVYDISVPKSFVDKQGKIEQSNALARLIEQSNTKNQINIGSTHGNTFSPIEQNYYYIKSLNNNAFDTVDVEQSLLARSIQNYNNTASTKINFSAVNLITDKPYGLLSKIASSNDLDHIDKNQKSVSRKKAVNLILDNLSALTKKQPIACLSLF